uniref:Uncharacterized protein n=1 Tax=Ixodes ricinus TaxID=34613 RepID=A0A6B0UTB2_IXORI
MSEKDGSDCETWNYVRSAQQPRSWHKIQNVGIHFCHPDLSVLRRHRMTVSSAEVLASWKSAKAVHALAEQKLASTRPRIGPWQSAKVVDANTDGISKEKGWDYVEKQVLLFMGTKLSEVKSEWKKHHQVPPGPQHPQ